MGRNFFSPMAILNLKTILIGIASVLITSSLAVSSINNNPLPASSNSPEVTIRGIVLPHHLLVQNQMEEFYKLVATNRPNINKIILLSPNHFLYGFHYIHSTTHEFTFKNSPSPGIPELFMVTSLPRSSRIAKGLLEAKSIAKTNNTVSVFFLFN